MLKGTKVELHRMEKISEYLIVSSNSLKPTCKKAEFSEPRGGLVCPRRRSNGRV